MYKVKERVGEYFEVNRQRQGCVISPWVFNVLFDRVVRKVTQKAKSSGKGGIRVQENKKLRKYYMKMMQCSWQNQEKLS